MLPNEFLKRMASKKAIARLVSKDLTVNRAALSMLSESTFLTRGTLEDIALRIIKKYKRAYKAEIEEGASKSQALDDAMNDRKLVVQRVQNSIVHEVSEEVRDQYRGEYYEWLPSDADNPDPLHQLNYGKRFQIGRGEMPGERYGCRCGMHILVDETRLEL